MSELRAVTIAHTGRGNAGHGLHRAFEDNPRVRMVALADPDTTGRAELAAEHADGTVERRPAGDQRGSTTATHCG